MSNLTMTVTGWVATDPRHVVTRDGDGPRMCTFRMAQTSRYFARGTGEWADRQTEWFTVRVFRDAAISVAESIVKGQPVIVEGRLRTNEWTDKNKNPRVDLQLDATAVGHDLTRGTAKFNRLVVTGGEEESETAESEALEPEAYDSSAFEEGAPGDQEHADGAFAHAVGEVDADDADVGDASATDREDALA